MLSASETLRHAVLPFRRRTGESCGAANVCLGMPCREASPMLEELAVLGAVLVRSTALQW